MDTGEDPASWAEGLGLPIYEKGNKKDSCNYRRITVPPVFGKLFELLFNKKLYL